MNQVVKNINGLVTFTKWISALALAALMLLVTYSVVMRSFKIPVLGQIELVQVLMAFIVPLSFAFGQKENAHIDIDFIKERLSRKAQDIIFICSKILIFCVCVLLSIVFFKSTGIFMSTMRLTTDVLSVPLYPFHFIIAVGFLVWGLAALTDLYETCRKTGD